MTEDQDKIEWRIRALLAKASGTENEHEAAAFAAKAQEMLARYNLDAAAVLARGQSAEAPVITKALNVRYTDPWRNALARDVARLYFCDVFLHYWADEARLRRGVTFVGRSHNVAIAISMTEYLWATVGRLARAYSKERRLTLGFERGCGERIAARLRAMRKETINKAATGLPPGSGGGLPALYDTEQTAVAARMAQEGLYESRGRGSNLANDAARAGWRAGADVGLDPQIGGASAHTALPGRK